MCNSVVSFFFLILIKPKYSRCSQCSFKERGLVPIFLFVLYFISKGSLYEAIFWIFEPTSGFRTYVVTSIIAKIQWVQQVIFTTLPLIFLMATSYSKNRRIISELNIAWVLFLPTVFLISFLPGFTHYYFEILPALSIQAAFGVYYLSQKGFNLNKKIIIGIILLGAIGISLFQNQEMYYSYKDADDFPLTLKLSYYIREHTEMDDSIFIFETAWPKLGPNLYFLSEREPPIPNLAFFPWHMSDVEMSRILSTVENMDATLIVLIGPDPIISEVIQIQEKIDQKYTLIEEYSNPNTIYPHIGEDFINIKIYRRE